MDRAAHIFRETAERIGVPMVQDIIKQPGVKAVYRITLHHYDFRAADSVATVKSPTQGDVTLDVRYLGRFNHQPLTRRLSREDYERLNAVFRDIKFDKMIDQQDVSPYGVDLCMVERGAGSFVKSVIFAPQKVEGAYTSLFNAIHAYLPEVLREV